MSDHNQFDDDPNSIEDTDLTDLYDSDEGTSSEWEDYDEEVVEGDLDLEEGGGDIGSGTPDKGKKKSALSNLVIVGVALLLGGGFFVLKSGGGTKAPPTSDVNIVQSAPTGPAEVPGLPGVPAEPVRITDTAVIPEDSESSEPLDESSEGKGFLNDPRALRTLQKDLDQVYETTEVVLEEKETPVDLIPVPPMPTAMQLSQGPSEGVTSLPEGRDEEPREPRMIESDSPGLPKIDDIMIKKPESSAALRPVEEAVPAQATQEVTASRSAAKEQADGSLGQRVAEVERTIESIRLQMKEPSDNHDIKATIEALEKSISALSAKVDLLSARSAAAIPPPVSENKIVDHQRSMTSATDMPTPPPVKPRPQILGPAYEEVPTPPDVQSANLSASEPVSAQFPSWVLKGAQPGQAMVSRVGEGEMQTVKIGDSLTGIGRITDISYQNSRWVVQGTQGRIEQ